MINKTIMKDEELALKHNIAFEVATKTGRGKPWITVRNDILKLSDAFNLVANIEAYEVGIFIDGYIYWTTHNPTIYNSIL